MLSAQRDKIAHALPAGLASALGPTGLLEGVAGRLGEGVSTAAPAARATAAEATRAASAAAHAPQRGGSSPWRWIVGAAAVLGLLWVAYQFLSRDEQVRDAADRPADTAARVDTPAQNLLVGDVDVGQQVTGVVETATTALNGVTDAASAQAAVPKLNELNDSLTKLSGLVDQLPAQGKSTLAALVSWALPNLEALVNKVSEIPGAGDLIKPVADPMLEKVRAMTA
jgi:hypothetical protein